MKIGLIRHFPVDHSFLKGFVSQSQVLEWFRGYDNAEIKTMQVDNNTTWDICYSSQLPRAKKTAELIFKGEIISTELLNEPSPSPLFKKDLKLPFKLWALAIRLAIIYNHLSQADRKEIIEKRIEDLITQTINGKQENVLIVSHVFVLEILSRALIKKGFTGTKLSMPKHGLLYTYTKVNQI